MNNTILLIVCDFLLLNIIHFTAWDKLEDEPGKTPATGGHVESGSGMGITTLDMESVILKYRNIKADLENEERKNANLQSEMNATQQQSAEKFKNATDVAIALKDESEKFKKERDKLKNENTNLKQTNIILSENNGRLKINLSEAKTDARDARNDARDALNNAKDARDDAKAEAKAASDARIAQTKAEGVRDQAIAAAKTTRQNAAERIEKAEDRAKTAEQKQEEAGTRARVANDKAAEATKNLAVSKTKTEELANALQIEREQKIIAQAGLVQLRRQIAERIPHLPKTPNEIAICYFQNQVELQLQAIRGSGRKKVASPAVLIEIIEKGKPYVYAITYANDTPYRLTQNARAFREIYGSLAPRDSKSLALRAPSQHVRFLKADPRVITIPLGTADSPQVKALGVTPYKLAAEPFKFPEAFIMSKNGRKFGTVEFKIDPKYQGYVKVDRIFFNFGGRFNPAKGDLVFSQTGAGELLGIMVNNSYCLMIQNTTLAKGGSINFGKNDSNEVAQVLDNMRKLIAAKPFALQ